MNIKLNHPPRPKPNPKGSKATPNPNQYHNTLKLRGVNLGSQSQIRMGGFLGPHPERTLARRHKRPVQPKNARAIMPAVKLSVGIGARLTKNRHQA